MTSHLMTSHVMTRGTPRRLDYRFLGAGPPQRWWAPLEDWIAIEEPEVVVHGGPGGCGVLLSGIPSARRDVVGTAIRYTLVVDGPAPELLLGLACAGLADAGRAGLGAALDAEFPAAWVDAALDATPPEGDVAARIARALGSALRPPPAPVAVAAASWVGSADDERAVAGFVARVADLGAGDGTGWAFTTSALTSVDGARRAGAALGVPVAVLLTDGGPGEAVDLGKAPAGRPAGVRLSPATGRTRRRPPIRTATVLLVAVLLVLLLLVWTADLLPT